MNREKGPAFSMEMKRFTFRLSLGLLGIFFSWSGVQTTDASCGSGTCFVIIGSEQRVSPKGLLTLNAFYDYTPRRTWLSGTNEVIPTVDLDNRQFILGHHREIRTINRMYTLNLNYGVTDRFGLEIAIPYIKRSSIVTAVWLYC